MRGTFILTALGLLAACSQQPGVVPPDDTARQLIVGPWSPAEDSDDFGTLEEDVFAADGTYVVNFYTDATCRMQKGSGNFKWSIDKGILSTAAADSQDPPSQDQIITLTNQRLKTRSVDEQTLYSRKRGYLCPTRDDGTGKTPGSHQTDSKEPKAPPPLNAPPKSHFGHT